MRSAQEALSNTEDRLVDIVGPRGLQLLVADRRKHGILLPFRVNMRKNSRLALVQYPLPEMGEMTPDQYVAADMTMTSAGHWKDTLKAGAQLYIGGILFIIQASIINKKKPESNQKGANSMASMDSEKVSVTSSKTIGNRMKKTNYSEKSNTSGDRSICSMASEEVEKTEDHIRFDRPWLLEDADQLEVFRLVPRIFYMQPVYKLRRLLLKTYVIQKIVAIMAIHQHKLSSLYNRIGGLFDDDSATYSMLQKWSVRAIERKHSWLKLSYLKVEMTYDFSLRRIVSKMFWSSLNAVRAVARMVGNIAKVVNSGAEETPFDFWQRSLEKESVQVEFDLGNSMITCLGDIVLDLKAPCDIMREHIHRTFRKQLNESIGESFLFALFDEESNKLQMLPREDEYRTFAKTYAKHKVDARTFMSSLNVLLIKDRTRGRVFIPEFATKVEVEQEDDEQQAGEDDVEMQRLLKSR
jgi:hypothetical protein